jgi:hypothetical protein
MRESTASGSCGSAAVCLSKTKALDRASRARLRSQATASWPAPRMVAMTTVQCSSWAQA